MSEYEYTHNVQLMTSQWPSFFTELANQRKGRDVRVEVDGNLLQPDSSAEASLLKDLKYHPVVHDRKVTVITRKSEDVSDVETVLRGPSIVWDVRNQHGDTVAVQIIGEDSHKLVLRFED